jgi:NitT/TauT family transport system substrate-binding protein
MLGAGVATAALGTRAARSQTLTAVRVGGGVDDGLTPLLYALNAGMFKRSGLDVQIQASANGAALAAALVGGGIDVAKSALMSIITAYARGVHFKIIAGSAQYLTVEPTDQLCVLKTSNIKALADMNGKTIAVSTLRGLDMIGIQAMVDKGGGNASTVQFVEIPFSAMLSALEQGRTDVASISNPHLAAALESGKVRTFGDPYGGIAKRLLIAGWITTGDYAAQNPSIVQRFAQVIEQANAYSNAHHDETAPILAQYAHIDPAVILKMNRLTNATTLDPGEIQPVIDTVARYKIIDKPFSAKELLL